MRANVASFHSFSLICRRRRPETQSTRRTALIECECSIDAQDWSEVKQPEMRSERGNFRKGKGEQNRLCIQSTDWLTQPSSLSAVVVSVATSKRSADWFLMAISLVNCNHVGVRWCAHHQVMTTLMTVMNCKCIGRPKQGRLRAQLTTDQIGSP